METINEYQQQAIDFLKETNTTFKAEFLKNDYHFTSDKEKRDIYKITLQRGQRKFSFDFGQSLNNSGFYYTKGKKTVNIDRNKVIPNGQKLIELRPTQLANYIKKSDYDFLNNGKSDIIHFPVAPNQYDVLVCLTKYDVGTFEDFCSEFGYDTDSKTAEKTYKAVCKEYDNVCKLFSDNEIEQLQEIQ